MMAHQQIMERNYLVISISKGKFPDNVPVWVVFCERYMQ